MMTKMEEAADSSDANLVSQSLSGNREAFAQIVARYQTLICSLAYSGTGSLSQSEDLAQETFLTAYRQLAGLREPQKLRSWLCSIARHRISFARKQQGREPTHDAQSLDILAESPASEPHPCEAAISREEQTILWQAVERVPEIYREPLVLFYREHGSVETVARDLDLTEDAVKQRLSRGRKLLQEQVLAFVEGALEKTKPSHAFTIGVVGALAALPAMSISIPAAKAASLGSTGKGVVAGKGAAAAGGAGAGAILAFIMSSAKITTAALVALLAAAGGFYYGSHSERESAASLARARLESQGLAAQVRALEKQTAAASQSAQAPAPKPDPEEKGDALMAAHPELREMLHAMGKSWAAGRTFRIARALNLSPEQRDQLAEIWSRYDTYGSSCQTKGGEWVDLLSTPAPSRAAVDNELHALLGDANYEKFQYLLKLDGNDDKANGGNGTYQIMELSWMLYLTDTPLTSRQAWGIDEIRYDLEQTLPKDAEPEARWKLFQERVKPLLSPEQMKAFVDVGDEYINGMAQSKMARADEEAVSAEAK